MFAPQIQFWAVVTAIGLFAATSYLARATRRATALALTAALIFTGLNIVWDFLAFKASWWWYPARTGPFAPLPMYLAQDLVWGGAFGLVGWRIYRRSRLFGLISFVLLMTVVGSLRDFAYASTAKDIKFGAGVSPRLADLLCWLTLLAISQVITCVSGPPRADYPSRMSQMPLN